MNHTQYFFSFLTSQSCHGHWNFLLLRNTSEHGSRVWQDIKMFNHNNSEYFFVGTIQVFERTYKIKSQLITRNYFALIDF